MKYNQAYSSPGCKIYIDNIKLYEPPQNDLGVTTLLSPVNSICENASAEVKVIVENKGLSAQNNVPVVAIIGNDTITANSGNIPVFGSDTVVVGNVDASQPGVYNLTAYATLASDQDNSNDTLYDSFEIYAPLAVDYVDGFEGPDYYWGVTTGWYLGTSHGKTGKGLYKNFYGSQATGYAEMTRKIGPIPAGAALSFDYRLVNWSSYPNNALVMDADSFLFMLSADCGTTYDTIYVIDSSNHVTSTDWAHRQIDLTSYVGQKVIIKVEGKRTAGDYYFDLDNYGIATPPSVDLGPDTTICIGVPVQIDAGGATSSYSYIWTYGLGASADTIATSQTISPDSAGTYVVEVTAPMGMDYDTIVVSTNPLPTVAASILGNDTICYGDSTQVSLSFTGASPWNFDISTGSKVFSDSTISALYQPYADPDTTTSFTVIQITDGNGCVQTMHSDTLTVTVNDLPIVAMSTLSDVCEDMSAFTLTGGSPANGTYSGLGVNTSTSTFDAATAGSGNHNITYHFTDANGCTDSATTIQKVNALPSINATAGANPAPYNTATTLSAAVSNAVGTLSYAWTPTASINGSATDQTVNTISITAATTYVVNVTDAGTSCQNTDTVEMSYSGGPISVNPIAVPSSVCYGDTTQLKAQASGGNGGTSYTWTSNPAGYSSTSENPFASITQDTWFIVYATDGANSAKDSVLVTVLANPTVSYSVDSSAVCNGETAYAIANFTGSAPFSYTYNGIIVSGITSTVDSVMVNTTTDVMYRLTSVTDNNSCSSAGDLDSMIIHVNALPTIAASDNDTICNGDSAMITLNFTGASPWSYDVYDGTSTMTNSASTAISNVYAGPSTSTNYMVTSVTDNNGCVTTGNLDSVYIMVNSLPTVVASDNDSICFGDSSQITLTFTGAAPYSFSVNDGSNVFTDNSATNTFMTYTSPDATTNYVLVSLTDDNGCNVSGLIDSVEILVHALPAKPSFTGLNAAYCVDASDATLTPNPVGGTFSGTGVSGNFFSPSTAGVGTHDVVYTVTDVYNCVNGDTMSTVVNALPIVQLSGLASDYCVDAADAQLSGTPTGGTFMGTGLTASNEFSPSTAGVGTYTIKYSYTDGNSCTNVDSSITIVNALPVITMPTLSPVCVDAASFALTGATPAGGNWSGNGVSNNNFNAPTAGAGSHYLSYTYTDANSCTNLDSTTITVNALPVLSVSGLNPEYCLDDAVATMVATPAGGTFYGPGVSGTSFDPATAGVGQFNLLYFYTDANGCFNSTNMNTLVHALPVVDLGADTTICAVNNTILDAGSFVSYLWNTGDTTQVITVDSTGYGIGAFYYNVLVTDANSCSNMDSVEITYEASPVSQLSDSAEICGENESIFLDAGYTSGNNYVWDNGVNWSSVTIDTSDIGGTTGYMGVTISSPIGCTSYDSAYVYFKEVPVVNLGNDTTICWTQNITFDAGAGFSSYLWNTGATTQTLSVDSFTFVLGMNTYSVEVTNSVNCSASDSVDLMIDPCTGILTPVLKTADINVYPNPTKGQFQIDINGMENADYDLSIYNSLGSKVFGDNVNYNSQSTQSWKLDFSTYPKGIYFIRLQSEGQIKVKRIIIQ
jgi:hypothetical protein